MQHKATVRIAGLITAALAIAAPVLGTSCGQTPTNVPIRTFEGAQKVAVVCLHVKDQFGNALPSVEPVPQSNCAPVPANVDGTTLPYHLFAAVTQTTRGELAVVDLTGGTVVDEDKSTPGTNFIPVGTNPTDVAVAPDLSTAPRWTFVSSAAPTKAALYAIDNTRILGDWTGTTSAPLLLTDLAACSLPQPPIALAVSSPLHGPGAASGDAGAGLGDGGPVDPSAPAFRIIALLGGRGGAPPTVAEIDPGFATTAPPGALPPCTILGSTPLSTSATLPPTWMAGPAWPDGVPYVDGGAPNPPEPALAPSGLCSAAPFDAGAMPMATTGDAGVMGATVDAGEADAGSTDGSTPDADVDPDADTSGVGVVDVDGSPAADAAIPLALAPQSAPRPVAMVLRDDVSLLYVADAELPVIHVLDVSVVPPRELQPLLATSLQQPTRQVQVGALALSPSTRDYKRYLYAVDDPAGSLMVFDVTDPATSPHVPLVRPHGELNPLAPKDRLSFSAPVATVAFVQHDWPLVLPSAMDQSNAYTGLLCNPNIYAYGGPNAFRDLGAHYRADLTSTIQAGATVESLPFRLRGVFGFATLTDGTVVTIDVDDWDAPCRRWDPMTADQITGSLAVPQQPPAGSTDLDPYHAPNVDFSLGEPVTLEPFAPVSAPHRMRSSFLLRNDPTSGNHVPQITQSPVLVDSSGMQTTATITNGVGKPILLPTVLSPGFISPADITNPTEPNPMARVTIDAQTFPSTAPPVDAGVRVTDAGGGPATNESGPSPGVRLSFDDPAVQQNQDWSVTYEGTLPGSQNIVADLSLSADRQQLQLTINGGDLCSLGIEDARIGSAKAAPLAAAVAANPLLATYPVPSTDPKNPGEVTVANPETRLPEWTADYVEVIDDLLASTDPYWATPQDCWDVPISEGKTLQSASAGDRYGYCSAVFGASGSTADQYLKRDAPILEAYSDHLVTGTYGLYPTTNAPTSDRTLSSTNRVISSGGSYLPRLTQCCFHKLARVKVRAGGEWLAVGNSIGLLHHVQADQKTNACVLSCDPHDALLNGRSFDVPWSTPNTCAPVASAGLDRNNPLAMRNPMFSYVMWSGCGPLRDGDHTLTARDVSWRFSVGGGFTPLTIALSGTTGVSVSPQSMLFINSLGQLAVVDGSSQGLVLIDLNTVTFARNYF